MQVFIRLYKTKLKRKYNILMTRRKSLEPKDHNSKLDSTVPEANDDDTRCPVCKTDRFLNPQLELLVSPCYHRVCRLCVDNLFAHGASACPVCQTPLRRSNFSVPLFEDLCVEKECRIRQRLAGIFNKAEEDFETLRHYNDYLEEVESLVWNLMNDVDVQATNAKLDAYQAQNREIISRNAQRRLRAEQLEMKREKEEAQHRLDYETHLLAEMEAEEREKQEKARTFIEDLARSGPATADQKKRRLQDATRHEMPSLRGLKKAGSSVELSPIDPFDTVPAIVLPEPLGSRSVEWDEFMCLGSRAGFFSESLLTQMCSGGLSATLVVQQIRLAAFSF